MYDMRIIATDFIVSLPKTKNCLDSSTTWVDRLTRRVHFIPSKNSDNAVDVANSFFRNVFPCHGIPDSIVSDRHHNPRITMDSIIPGAAAVRFSDIGSSNQSMRPPSVIVNRIS